MLLLVWAVHGRPLPRALGQREGALSEKDLRELTAEALSAAELERVTMASDAVLLDAMQGEDLDVLADAIEDTVGRASPKAFAEALDLRDELMDEALNEELKGKTQAAEGRFTARPPPEPADFAKGDSALRHAMEARDLPALVNAIHQNVDKASPEVLKEARALRAELRNGESDNAQRAKDEVTVPIADKRAEKAEHRSGETAAARERDAREKAAASFSAADAVLRHAIESGDLASIMDAVHEYADKASPEVLEKARTERDRLRDERHAERELSTSEAAPAQSPEEAAAVSKADAALEKAMKSAAASGDATPIMDALHENADTASAEVVEKARAKRDELRDEKAASVSKADEALREAMDTDDLDAIMDALHGNADTASAEVVEKARAKRDMLRDEKHAAKESGETEPWSEQVAPDVQETPESPEPSTAGAESPAAEEAAAAEAAMADEGVPMSPEAAEVGAAAADAEAAEADATAAEEDAAACSVCGITNNCCTAGGSWFGQCPNYHTYEEGNKACLALPPDSEGGPKDAAPNPDAQTKKEQKPQKPQKPQPAPPPEPPASPPPPPFSPPPPLPNCSQVECERSRFADVDELTDTFFNAKPRSALTEVGLTIHCWDATEQLAEPKEPWRPCNTGQCRQFGKWWSTSIVNWAQRTTFGDAGIILAPEYNRVLCAYPFDSGTMMSGCLSGHPGLDEFPAEDLNQMMTQSMFWKMGYNEVLIDSKELMQNLPRSIAAFVFNLKNASEGGYPQTYHRYHAFLDHYNLKDADVPLLKADLTSWRSASMEYPIPGECKGGVDAWAQGKCKPTRLYPSAKKPKGSPLFTDMTAHAREYLKANPQPVEAPKLWRPGHDYRDGAKAEVPTGYERLRGKRGAALAEELARRLKSSPYSLLKFVP